MQKRWWVLLAIGFFLFAMTTLVWWAGRKPNDAAMALVFIGYTNQFPPSTSGIPAMPSGERKLVLMPGEHIALLRAANTGSVPVEARTEQSWATVDAFESSPPQVLKPGESMMVHVIVDPSKGPWSTELIYSRHGFREKLYEWTLNANTPNILQRPLDRAFYPESVRVKCGPITNQPPPNMSFRRRFYQSSDPFLKFIEPRPSVRSFQPPTEDILMKTNTPVRKID